MAKKKAHHSAAVAPSPPASGGPSPEAEDNLKTLNRMLLRETVDLRGQVADLKRRPDDDVITSEVDVSIFCTVVAEQVRFLEEKTQEEVRVSEKEQEELAKCLGVKERELGVKKEEVRMLDAKVEELFIEIVRLRGEKEKFLKQEKEKEVEVKLVKNEKEVVTSEFEKFKKLAKIEKSELEEKIEKLEVELEKVNGERKSLEEKIVALELKCSCLGEENDKLEQELGNWKVEFGKVKKEEERVKFQMLTLEKKYVKVNEELDRVRGDLHVSEKGKEESKIAFEEEKRGILMDLENLRRKMEGIVKEKHLIESLKNEKEIDVERLNEEMAKLNISLLELRGECKELNEKNRSLHCEKDLIARALDVAKLEACDLRANIEELVRSNGEKEVEIEELKAELDAKGERIDGSNKELELLQVAMAEAQRKKWGLWSWLYPATTTILAAISFAYVARGRRLL